MNPCVDLATNSTVFMMKDDTVNSLVRIFQPFLTIVCMDSFYSQKLHFV